MAASTAPDPRLFSGCFDTLRSVFNHVLATTPEQVVRHGALEHVTTPGGVYEVVWTHTTDVITWNPNCADGPTPVNDNAFAASRTVR